MRCWDVRVLAGSYINEHDQTIIELFGKTRDNKSITIRITGFKPYFHLVSPPSQLLAELDADDHVLKIDPCKLYVDNVIRNCVKVTVKYPFEVPTYRNKCKSYCKVLAADIPFVQRFFYDLDLGSCFRVWGEELEPKLRAYTTAIVIRTLADKKNFEACEPFKPQLTILSFDIENSITHGTIHTLCCAIRSDSGLHYEQFVGSEYDIMTNFVSLVKKEDPDVITGYNIEGYDLPVLQERAKAIKFGKFMLGRDGTELRSRAERVWHINGRIIADAWWNAKQELRPKHERLNYIAKLVLGEEKDEVEPTKIDEEWAKDREKVIRYCTRDAELALRIIEKIGVLEKAMALAEVTKLPVDEVLNTRTSVLLDSILIREADRANIGVPCMRHGWKDSKILGGYVHAVEPGLYHWVCVMDYKSMYPSIIISKNICFTTLSPDGEIVSPSGIRFLSPARKVGLLPRILKRLMADRELAKRKMIEATTIEELQHYDRVQNAIKILMNAFYGVFASAFYRFTDARIGGSITAFARENIQDIIHKLEAQNITVIYSDTDSVFFESPYHTLAETVEFGKKLAAQYSEDGVVLEFEKVIEPYFTHGKKKRYVGTVIWPTVTRIERGYETRRTDSFDLQSEALSKVFDEILSANLDGAIKYAREIVADTQKGNVPLEKLVISKTAKLERFYKEPSAQANVQAMQKLKALGYEFVPGMKVSYIVTNSRKTPQEVEPYIHGRPFRHTPDWQYYAERLALSIARVTDVFGWNEKTLLTGVEQKSLFSAEFIARGEDLESISTPSDNSDEPRAVKRVPKGKLTLEDFL